MRHALRASLLFALAACGPTGELAEATAGPDPGTSGTTGDPPARTSETPTSGTTIELTTTGTTDATTSTTDAPTTDASSSSTGEPAIDCKELAIADPILLAEIRDQLEIPEGPISGAAALGVVTLYLTDGPVATLAGVECLKNLQALRAGGSVSDLSPLAGLEKFTELGLHDSEVSDLSPLVGLPLNYLSMQGSPLGDLGPLAQIPTLATLVIASTSVQDLTPLTSHSGLEAITADGTFPLDLLPLATIPRLERLSMKACSLDDVSALAGAAALQQLYLDDNVLVDLDGLATLTQLTTLHAPGNQITGVAPLSGLGKLERLRLQNNEISDLQPLAGATALDSLDVSGNPLTGLDGLEALPLLHSLTANTAGLKALVAVAPKTLTSLSLEGNQLVDLSPLVAHQVLFYVHLDDNAITSLAPIEEAPWVQNRCAFLLISGNPLDATTLATTLPALCDLDMTIAWTQGECAPDGFRCGISDP